MKCAALVVTAALFFACAGGRVPGTPASNPPAAAAHAIPPECDELLRAKAQAFDGTAEDSFPSKDASLNDGRLRFALIFHDMGVAGTRCLRAMMDAERTDSAFLFRAANMLLEIHRGELGDRFAQEPVAGDDREASMKAARSALARVDLRRVQRFTFVDDCVMLARHGIDTGELAEKYLACEAVEDDMPTRVGAQEQNRLGRDYGALFLYGTMPAARADEYLVHALRRPEPYARSSAALAACMNATPACFAALRIVEGRRDFPEGIRKEIEFALIRKSVPVTDSGGWSREEIIDSLHKTVQDSFCIDAGGAGFLDSAISTLRVEDVDLVREARRHSIQHAHEVSLGQYLFLTKVLYGLINRYDLYADARRGS